MSKNPPFQRNIQTDINDDFWDDVPESQHEDPTSLFKQSLLDDPSLMADEGALSLDLLQTKQVGQTIDHSNEDWQSVSKKLNVALTPELWALLNELHEQAQSLGLQVSRAQMIRIAVQHFQMAWLNHKENGVTTSSHKKRNPRQKSSAKAKEAPTLTSQDEDEWQVDVAKKSTKK
jgi:hypothetical protein